MPNSLQMMLTKFMYINKSKFLALYDAISLICSFYSKRLMGRVSSQNLSLRQSKISPSQNVVETLVESGEGLLTLLERGEHSKASQDGVNSLLGIAAHGCQQQSVRVHVINVKFNVLLLDVATFCSIFKKKKLFSKPGEQNLHGLQF